MTIRLVPVSNFNNPNLPIGDFVSPLARPEAIAYYDMLSPTDGSGNGHDLFMGGHTFGPQGMISHPVKGYYADTGIVEPDSFTVVIAHNFIIEDTVRNVISSLKELVSPFTGSRLALTQQGSISLAVGRANQSALLITDGSAVGGWTVYSYTIAGKDAVVQRAAGTTFPASMAAGDVKNLAGRTMSIAGNPTTDYVGGATTVPPNGVIGCLGIYAGDLGVGGRAGLINDAKRLMARRGVIIP